MQDKINEIPEISVTELHQKIINNEDIVILDVREQSEYDICNLKQAVLIPLGELEDKIDSLNKEKEYLVHCKLGGRSAKAVQVMQENGFNKVYNVAGGIRAWSEKIDTTMPIY